MKDIIFEVEHIKFLTSTVFELKLKSDEKLPEMRPGQFLHLKVNDSSVLLRRPFCLYKFDEKSVTLIIAIVGKGTTILSQMKKGEKVFAIVPVGNGFTLGAEHKKIALIGGGVGCAPLLAVPKFYKDKEFRAFLGFASKSSVMFEDDFKKACKTFVSTDDGSYGFKGYVTESFILELNNFKPDVILTCGSENMLKAVAKRSVEYKIPAYMSGETRMACGVGACLVCACAVKGEDGIYHNKRACVDGPVFKLEDVML